MRKYLILGASSDIAMGVLKTLDISSEDEILIQYRKMNDRLDEILKSICAKVYKISCDFESDESVDAFCEQIDAMEFIPTHMLHAAATPVANRYFKEENWELVNQQLDVQLKSLFKILKIVLPKMARERQGKIVTILTSYTFGMPPKYLTSYIVGKYATMGFMKSLAQEYEAKGIAINMVSPSLVETKFCDNISKHVIENSAKNSRTGKNISVDEVADVINELFEKDEFVTGQNILIDN